MFASIFRNAVLDNNIVIGGNTTVGEGSVVKNSIIGNNCKIGMSQNQTVANDTSDRLSES